MHRLASAGFAALAVAGALLGGAGTATADTAVTTGDRAWVMACAWTENVDHWIMGHNECSYAVKWVIGIPDPLGGPGVQESYTPCVQPHSMRDIARRGTPLKGTVHC